MTGEHGMRFMVAMKNAAMWMENRGFDLQTALMHPHQSSAEIDALLKQWYLRCVRLGVPVPSQTAQLPAMRIHHRMPPS